MGEGEDCRVAIFHLPDRPVLADQYRDRWERTGLGGVPGVLAGHGLCHHIDLPLSALSEKAIKVTPLLVHLRIEAVCFCVEKDFLHSTLR